MKKFLILCCVVALVLSMGLCGCKYDKDGDGGYVPRGEYALPNHSTAEKGTVPYAVAELVAKGQVIRDYYSLNVAAIGAEEGYCIRTNGINIEIYRFADDSPFFAKIKELNAYPIMDDAGNVLATNRAVINGNLVMMIPTDTNSNALDMTEQNHKLAQRFAQIK